MSIPKDRYAVFEYNDNASERYQGTRFMTSWIEPIVERKDSNTDIIAQDIPVEEARRLIQEKSVHNTAAYITGLPDELRSKETDAYIASLLLKK